MRELMDDAMQAIGYVALTGAAVWLLLRFVPA